MFSHWAAYHFKNKMDQLPSLYLAALRFKHRRSGFLKRIVLPSTDICIEGYNRSANSFAVKAFRDANDTEDYEHKVATHVHTSSHVIRAIQLNVPTMVLIREPEATVISQKALAIQLNQVRHPRSFPIEIFLAMYARFYERLIPFKDSLLVATFEQVTNDYGQVMRRFNERFNTAFNTINHTPEKEAAIFSASRLHLSPSSERQKIKSDLESEIDQLIGSKYLNCAKAAHRNFLALEVGKVAPKGLL